MEELIMKIESDIKINQRCINEDISDNLKNILELWIKYDEELLAIIRKEEINDNRSTKKSK